MRRYQVSKHFKISVILFCISLPLLISPLAVVGIAGVCLALFCFLTFAGFKVVTVKPFEDSAEYKECFFGKMYNVESRLEKEKKRLAELHDLQNNVWRDAATGGILAFCGLFIIVFSCIMLKYIPFLFFGIWPGLYILIMSPHWFWHAYINSDRPSAQKISELFLLRTYSVLIEETSKKVGALTQRAARLREEEAARRAKDGEIRLWNGPQPENDHHLSDLSGKL